MARYGARLDVLDVREVIITVLLKEQKYKEEENTRTMVVQGKNQHECPRYGLLYLGDLAKVRSRRCNVMVLLREYSFILELTKPTDDDDETCFFSLSPNSGVETRQCRYKSCSANEFLTHR